MVGEDRDRRWTPPTDEPDRAWSREGVSAPPPASPGSDRRTGRGPLIALLGVAVIVAALTGAGAGFIAGGRAADDTGTPAAAASTVTSPTASATEVRIEASTAVSDAVQKVLPSMVILEVTGPEKRDSLGRLIQTSAQGSGVVIDTRGYIVTNAHVIADAQLIKARLSDGRELPGVVVAQDLPYTDLAIVRVQEGGLVAAEFGDSAALHLGETVATIGTPIADTSTPFAFENTVTVGVVSGLGRTWLRDGVVQEDLIQTDSALNHGNSGGALINMSGQVIGITSQVLRQAETGDTIEGIGFAIASDTVRRVAGEIIESGSVQRPDLGVDTVEITPELAAANGLPVDRGAFVQELLPSSAAAQAGMEQGDIIVSVAGDAVTLDSPLENHLKKYRPGDQVTIVVNRQGREVTLDVTLGSRD